MGVAHGADKIEIGRRANNGDAGAFIGRRFDFFQRALDEVGQLKVFKEDVEELFL